AARSRVIEHRLSDRVTIAESQLRQAQSALRATLADASAGKTGDLEAARADAARAKNAYLYAREEVGRMRIVAPFDGTIHRVAPLAGTIQRVAPETGQVFRPLTSGDAVGAGQELFTIATGSPFLVRTSIDEQDIPQVHTGDRAIISGEGITATLRAHITAIAP